MTQQRSAVGGVALVFAGGDAPTPGLAELLPAAALVIGADSGVAHAQSLGRSVDVAVGDFDSVAPATLRRAEQSGAELERHPRDKDATDLELALDVAVARGARRVTIVGGHGGRVDHFAANLELLGAPRFTGLEVDAWFGCAHVDVVRSHTRLHGSPGELVTLLAVGGPAEGVTTTGLRFPLRDAALLPGSTLGVSNELTESSASVTVRTGAVLAIRPDALPREDPA